MEIIDPPSVLDGSLPSMAVQEFDLPVAPLEKPDVAHMLPGFDSYGAIRAIARHNHMVALQWRLQQQVPPVTPESLANVFNDNVSRCAAARVCAELAMLKSVAVEMAALGAAATKQVHTDCWSAF